MNHEANEFRDYRTARQLHGYLHTDPPSSSAAWYAAGGLCAALILAAIAIFL